ncbi:pyridoxal phosphate-dependent decarboxylase family protein [Emcibacter sp.]|uniref:pyridoxal phosphate-dependent decarboxylase family protein n=1 Tax=Emcibacter sp. TaxID=1979954 RepID=UPI002AA88C1A|nr:aminotransferase class V-fold PLP-dependent enzyme [Emcibacter sp.]
MTNFLFDYVADAAREYRENIDDRDVMPTHEALADLTIFEEKLPVEPSDPLEVLRKLHTYGSPASVATTGRRFYGFVQGGALPVTVASNWLSTTWDQNAAPNILSPISGKLEDVAAGWILDIIDLPRDAGVGFVTGATMGAFSALAVARLTLLERSGYDLLKKGLFGAPEIRIVMSEEIHPMNIKALNYLGFGDDQIETIPCDDQGRVIPSQMPPLDDMTIVILQAGNINSGACDPFEEVCDLAHKAGAWVHVDGAFGAWARASEEKKYLAKGMEQADSWSFDCHKWLNVPYDSAVYVCRDSTMMRKVFGATATYLVEDGARDPHHYTPELSRRARGVDVWAALKFLGHRGVAEMIDRCCRHATRFAEGLEEMGCEVLNEVCLNQVAVTYGDEAQTTALMECIQNSGVLWLGPTRWKGRVAFRFSVSSWATTDEDVEKSLRAVKECLGKG